MRQTDARAQVNRRALECPDAASFTRAGPVGQESRIATIERAVSSGEPGANVMYLTPLSGRNKAVRPEPGHR